MPWQWDTGAQRYRDSDTGRFMPGERVREFVQQSITGTDNAVGGLIDLLADGKLAPKDFGDVFKREIKDEYIRQYVLGRGGLEQMTQADWGSIGGMLKEQYGYLPGFIDDIAEGKLTPGQIRVRAGMYINSAREGYERAVARNATATGSTEELWVLGATENHCPDCPVLADMGWVPVGEHGTYPGAGETQCVTNCLCHLEYRNPEGQVYGI